MPPEKKAIITELGSDALLLPSLVNDALLANDRVKYCFALLVAARSRADDPAREHPTLHVERVTAGVDDPELDDVVGGAVRCGPDLYSIPALGRLVGLVRGYAADMIRPLAVADVAGLGEVRRRFDEVLADLPTAPERPVSRGVLDRITSGDRRAGDSLHLLVMDVHKILNALQAALAEESIDGALAYGLTDLDRALVAAFMRGVNRTGPLRLDHPGLATTATRLGGRLVLQNDLGQTDAHVVVVAVEDLTVSITYTDIHMARLQFFQSMLEGNGITWTETLSRRPAERFERDLYHLSVGRFVAPDVEVLGAVLTHLGSRLVFLIDWNRARKRLRGFIPNRDAIALLGWAAEHEFGHMAFLAVVDETVIHDALDLVGRFPLRYGEPLHQMLGTERAVEYFRWVLQAASDGVRAGASRLALRDEIEAELARCFRSANEDLAGICERHAAITVDVAATLQECLGAVADADAPRAAEAARRAKDLERAADEQVVRVRDLARRIEAARFFDRVLGDADDIVDAVEEACFDLTLVRGGFAPAVMRDLGAMADLVRRQAESLLTALRLIRSLGLTPSRRDDLRPLLEAVDGVVDLERECDDVLRSAQREILGEDCEAYPRMHLALDVARRVEQATDAAMAAGYAIREHALATLRS